MLMFYTGLQIEGMEEELMDGVLAEILEEDDTEKFNKYLEDNKEMVSDPLNCCTVFDVCLWKAAKKCSVVMLNHSFTNHYEHLHRFCPSLLTYIATQWEDPAILQLMFKHCYAHHLSNQTYYFNILPIHGILLHTMNADPFTKWGKGDSIIKLIILIISARKSRTRLECARLVAENTSSINEVALGLFHGGDVKELAALLLLAYDDLFHSLKSGLPTVSYDGLPTISSAYMVSRSIHGEIPDVYALVYLFHKAGRALSNFYTSMPEDDNPADVILKVANLIKDAGFPITYRDVDLAHVYSFKNALMVSICDALGVETNEDINLGEKKHRFASVYCVPPNPCGMNNKYFGHRRHDHLYLQPAPQNHTISASKLALSSPSLRSVAFLAMRLKRGIRML